MTVIRVNKTTDYTVMSNTHFKEKEMSLRAKGLLSLMLSLPDEWDYSIMGLAQLSKDGKDSVMNALIELEEFGYLIRTRVTDEKGKFAGYEYVIYESPQTENSNAEKPYTENPNTEKPYTENPPQLNTNISNTNILNNNILNTNKLNTKEKRKKESSYDEILSSIEDDGLRDLYFEYIKMRKMIKAPMTDRALTMLIKKVNELEPNNVENKKKLLEVAIMNNWKSVYPLKDTGNASNGQGGQTSEQAQKVLKMFGG